MNIAPALDANRYKLVYLEVIRRGLSSVVQARSAHDVASCQLVGHPRSTRGQRGKRGNRLLM